MGLRHGKGVIIFGNGESYSGLWFGNKKHGFGEYRWPTGDIYTGDWKLDRVHGLGNFNSSLGDQVLGEWKWMEYAEKFDRAKKEQDPEKRPLTSQTDHHSSSNHLEYPANRRFQEYMELQEENIFGNVLGSYDTIPRVGYSGFYGKSQENRINKGRVRLAVIHERNFEGQVISDL